MCRLVGYLGTPRRLAQVLCQPEHSLVAQAYRPREMEAALLNADGFGVGWFGRDRDGPFTYRNTMPIWSDVNLPHIARFVESDSFVGYVRSATPGLAVDLSNCQPFTDPAARLLFLHNGYIDRFRDTLYLPLRGALPEGIYRAVHGTTDSEHIFALVLRALQATPGIDLTEALARALSDLGELAQAHQTRFCANVLLADGQQLVASRYALGMNAPTLYWLGDSSQLAGATAIASEPLFAADWQPCPEHSIITVGADRAVRIRYLPKD